MEDDKMSMKDIGIELEKMDARVDELQIQANAVAAEIEELTIRLKFYEIIMKDWLDSNE